MKINKKKQSSGFTLIEALFAAMLLGLVVAALAAASGAFTMANGYGVDLSTAEFLIEEIRELTTSAVDPEDPDYLPFDSLVTDSRFDGTPFGPLNARGETLPSEFGAFKQIVEFDYMASGDFINPVSGPTDFVRVTVKVTKGGQEISKTSWIRARLN